MPMCDRGRTWEGPVYQHCKHWYHGDICCWCDEADEPLRELLDMDEHQQEWHYGGVCADCGSGRDTCVEQLSGFGR